MSWYSDLVSVDVNEAARELAGNWRRFKCFVWGGEPEHRPQDCALLYLSNRDSDCLDASNEAEIHAALAPAMGLLEDGAMVESQSHNHFLVGHVDGIVIRCVDESGEPTWAFRKLYELAERLDAYPILDENDFSERQQAAADQTWKNCYTPAERAQYIRKHAEQFNFHGLAALMGCVRGKFFAGYASELLD